MKIHNNTISLKTINTLNKINKEKSTSLQKLSSGLRINKASDDASGLSISEKMRAQIRGTKQAVRNSDDGISLLQTAEGALNEITSLLQRSRELCIQGLSGTNSTDDAKLLALELLQISEQIDNISNNTTFNGKHIIGSNAGNVSLQIGANADENLNIKTKEINASTLNIDDVFVMVSIHGLFSNNLLNHIDDALKTVLDERTTLGSQISRLEFSINNLNAYLENLIDSESRIRDVDMALESVEFNKNLILSQLGNSMINHVIDFDKNILNLLY